MSVLRRSVVAVVAWSIFGAGCASPTGPDGFSVDGNWNGSWSFMSGGATVTDTITTAISQSGNSATGPWNAASGPSGTLTFTPTTSTSGSLTIMQTVITGQVCTATTTVTGTASGTRIELTLADFPTNSSCPWATMNRFVLTR
jgi:hypothetical protein